MSQTILLLIATAYLAKSETIYLNKVDSDEAKCLDGSPGV